MAKQKRTTITITILVQHKKRRHKKKEPDVSTIPSQLALKVHQCSNLQELHSLFFSLPKKSRATMDAFIQKREELDFLTGKAIFPILKHA